MIILDTHVWVWWVHDGERLATADGRILQYPYVTTIG